MSDSFKFTDKFGDTYMVCGRGTDTTICVRKHDDVLEEIAWHDYCGVEFSTVEADGTVVPLEVLAEFVKRSQENQPPQGMTFEEIEVACRNIGYDLSCGTCASVFYTGTPTGEHTCENPPAGLTVEYVETP